MAVVNVTEPSNPRVAGSIEGGQLYGSYFIAIAKDYAYLTSETLASVTAIDIANPGNLSW